MLVLATVSLVCAVRVSPVGGGSLRCDSRFSPPLSVRAGHDRQTVRFATSAARGHVGQRVSVGGEGSGLASFAPPPFS